MNSPSNGPAIAIRDLAKSYGPIQAVRGLTFDVERGEIFGFLGLNGAGKTTTIRILLDLLRPSRGHAQLLGFDCQGQSTLTRAVVGYMPGELGFYPDMTGLDVLNLMARLSGSTIQVDHRLRLADRLELAQTDLRRPLRAYSTGMKRKLGLIQALQSAPPLLILDEPTEGLDPLVQRTLHQLLIEQRSRGCTVFMSSHVLSEVERLCDRIGVIRGGELVLLSTVEEARRRSGRTIRIQFSRPVDAVALPAGMSMVSQAPDHWTVSAPGDVGALLPLLAALPVRDIDITEPALEDVLRGFYRVAAS